MLNKRTETEMLKDILEVLIEQGNLHRASLLNKSNINYPKGMKMLQLMSGWGWITLD